LPKVVTQRCLEQDLNMRPTDRKPKCLTVTPPRLLRCATSQDGITPQAVVFTTAATVIYSLGCGLYTLPAVPRSTQTSILRGTESDVSLKADMHYP